MPFPHFYAHMVSCEHGAHLGRHLQGEYHFDKRCRDDSAKNYNRQCPIKAHPRHKVDVGTVTVPLIVPG